MASAAPHTVVIDRKCFYAPRYFALAPTHGRAVALFILDIGRSRNMLEVYGVSGMQLHLQGYILVGNYPVRIVQVAGRLLSQRFFPETRYTAAFFVLTLDDCSGETLTMDVRVETRVAGFGEGELVYGDFVRVSGIMGSMKDFVNHLDAVSVQILGSAAEFEPEVAWWLRVLQMRETLRQPWRCEVDAEVVEVDAEDVILESFEQNYGERLSSPVVVDDPGSETDYYTACEGSSP